MIRVLRFTQSVFYNALIIALASNIWANNFPKADKLVATVNKHIMKPDYVTTGIVPDWGDYIEIKDEDQIQGLRQACQLARRILLLAGKSLKVYLNGYHGDTSETFLVGNVDEGGRNLVEVARRCRNEAITASNNHDILMEEGMAFTIG
ncbi:UNVERIFIED_CONTAM: hypothetical protein FKN15_043864 [Acipenser sinensis]